MIPLDRPGRLPALLLAGRRYRCPSCGRSFRRFLPGPGGRPQARCPRCGTLERHRALALFLREFLEGSPPRDVLHFAPDPGIRALLAAAARERYIAADLDPRPEEVGADVTAIPFEDASFDLVVCSHVLEHVPDDRAGMREIHRVLRPGGTALLQHPVDRTRAWTDEDPTLADPAEREARFAQHNHFRIYGRDLATRLEESGFSVTISRTDEHLTPRVRNRLRLVEPWEPRASGSDIYVCRRPTGPAAS